MNQRWNQNGGVRLKKSLRHRPFLKGSIPPAPASLKLLSSLYKQLCSRPDFWAHLETDSMRHFEILCCFRFHRMLDRSPQASSPPSCCSAIKLPNVELFNEDCWRVADTSSFPSGVEREATRNLRCRVSTHLTAGKCRAGRLPHLNKARKPAGISAERGIAKGRGLTAVTPRLRRSGAKNFVRRREKTFSTVSTRIGHGTFTAKFSKIGYRPLAI
jgi:hypothetical protein